jgi:hypothetical protein
MCLELLFIEFSSDGSIMDTFEGNKQRTLRATIGYVLWLGLAALIIIAFLSDKPKFLHR